MTRRAQDREDLLRDATAYPTRLQLRFSLGEKSSIVFAGFRASGAASCYFDQDPVYHFNANRQLRRAFFDGKLLKAEQGRLVSLQRQADDDEIALIRSEMSEAEQQLFCETALQQLGALQRAVATGEYQIDGQVQPERGDSALDRLIALLQELNQISIADSPQVAD
ncbi:MAG: hypothetical protein ACR2NM_09475 [Bythopirellula sp.]